MARKKSKKRVPQEQVPRLTEEQIRETLQRSVKGANELHEQLKRVFRMPERQIILD